MTDINIAKYLKLVFEDQDVEKASGYWKDGIMIQHNPTMPDGTDFLKKVMGNPEAKMKYEPGLILTDKDIISIHGRYNLLDGRKMIAVDYFRIDNNKIVEHWDVIQPEVPVEKTVSGHPMFPMK